MSSRSSFADSTCSGSSQGNLLGITPGEFGQRPSSPHSSAVVAQSPVGALNAPTPMLVQHFSSSSSTSSDLDSQDSWDSETITNSYCSPDTSVSPCSSAFPNGATPPHSAAVDGSMSMGRESTSVFADFVDDCNDETPTARFLRRSAAAENLLEIASHGYEGEEIVARMLLDDVMGENCGIRAIFRLSDEEAVAYPLTTTANGPWRYHSMRGSSRLLNLVTGYAEASTFFRETIPQVLADGVWGLPALLFLITSHPTKFLHWTDPFFLPRIGMRATALSPFWSREWLSGITILDRWLCLADREGIVQDVRVSHAQFILDIGTAALQSETLSIGIETGLGLSHLQDKIVVLEAIISACLTITNAPAFSRTPPLLPSFAPLITLCAKTLLNSESYHTPFWATWCGLTLKLLAVLREVPAVMETIHAHERSNLARLCLDIVLQRTQWVNQLGEEADSMNLPELRSKEDAFGILCSLPGNIFEIVLREKFESCTTQDGPKEEAFWLLEPLVWLSNMSPYIRAVRQAFHRSGACGFLGRVVNYQMPQGSHFGNRDMWRIKGYAITCIGIIMEQMDAFEFNRQITETLVASVGAIYEDDGTPLAERNQALYMLQRYAQIRECWHDFQLAP